MAGLKNKNRAKTTLELLLDGLKGRGREMMIRTPADMGPSEDRILVYVVGTTVMHTRTNRSDNKVHQGV
jgi:hypothetical protein